MKIMTYIKSDLERRRMPTFTGFIKEFLSIKGVYFRYQVWLRIVHFSKQNRLTKLLIAPWAYLVYRHYEYKYGIHANTNIHIGKGLKIIHGGNIYLNCASIGDNFTVYQGVTFGSKHDNDEIPIVENNVTVYTNAVICGPITIHNGSTIGANTYVDKDVPEGATVIGAKSEIIRREHSMNNCINM